MYNILKKTGFIDGPAPSPKKTRMSNTNKSQIIGMKNEPILGPSELLRQTSYSNPSIFSELSQNDSKAVDTTRTNLMIKNHDE